MFSKKDRSSSRSGGNTAASQIQHAGIDNLGNSCYLNSVLQGLAASQPLRDALVDYPGAEKAFRASESLISTTQGDQDGSQQDPTGSPVVAPGTPTAETSPSLQVLTRENAFPEGLPLSSALASTLVKLWSGKQTTISVKSLMKALNRKNEDWNEYDQMDAHELLRYLLDGVSMEEIDLIKKIQPATPAKPKKRKRSSTAAERKRSDGNQSNASSDSDSDDLDTSEAESLLAEDPTYRMPSHPPPPKRYTPFIDTIFGGKLASVIVCEECRGVSRIEEDFLDISLPLKSDEGKVKRRDRLRNFLSSSSANQSKADGQRPKLAPRAPTAILSVSETEGSEAEDLALKSSRSGASGISEPSDVESNVNGQPEDDASAKVRRRKSLDPGLLRSASTKRSFLNPMSAGGSAKSRDPSPLSRKSSVRTSGADTTGSEASSAVHARKSKSNGPSLLSKPTREQQEYIQKLFAEIPGPSPLAGLRIAQPHGSGVVHPTAAEANGSPLALADAMSTGLYTCLMQFTSVEMLEGENAFQCRRCWKLLNPNLVAQVGRRRANKAREAAAGRENARKAEQASQISAPTALLHRRLLAETGDGTPIARNETSKDYLTRETTPRASVSMGSSNDATIQTNRDLLAERERQMNADGTRDVSPVASLQQGKLHPEIKVTATSPPLSPPDSQQALPVISRRDGADEAGLSGFSQLTVTESRNTASDEGSSLSPQSGVDELYSDGGAEADDSDSESQSHLAKPSVRTSTVSFSDHSPPGRELVAPERAISADMPALPHRAQRYLSRRAHKRYLISSLPQILVLHLKRFQQTSKSSLFGQFSNLKKLDDKVTFPLYLDMAPFMAPPPLRPSHSSELEKLMHRADPASSAGEESDRGRPAKKEREHHHKHWFRRASPPAEMRQNCQYRLYAVIVHQGNMGSGHYIAYILTPQRVVEGEKVTTGEKEGKRQWLYCSDDVVKAASVDEVLKSQAYCLLYERVPPKGNPKL